MIYALERVNYLQAMKSIKKVVRQSKSCAEAGKLFLKLKLCKNIGVSIKVIYLKYKEKQLKPKNSCNQTLNAGALELKWG